MGPWGNVRDALNYMSNAVAEGFSDCLLQVPYDEFVHNPGYTMQRIGLFLDIAPFTYDFDNVVPPVQEDDSVFGLPNMHAVDKHCLLYTSRCV